MKVYFAASLFSRAERDFNQSLAQELRKRDSTLELLVPQEFTSAINRDVDFPRRAFDACVSHLRECDLILSIVDGADVDSGTSFELGFAYAIGLPIVLVRTDFRELEDQGLNLMLSQSTTHLLQDSCSTVESLADSIAEQLEVVVREG